MKPLLKKIVPSFIMDAYVAFRRRTEDRRNASRTIEEVFSEIYREKKWSEDKATGETFCSGTGSTTESIVEPYIAAISARLQSFESPPRVVDLGCGDFRVGRRLVAFCSLYSAVDVVPDLIAHLKSTVRQNKLEFYHLDITRDPLPDGEICLVRQVFQHLSNTQIEAVLAKMTKFSKAYVTEHHPEDSPSVVPNLDKVHGSAIRLFKNSGVYLDQPPFGRYVATCKRILEVPGHDFNRDASPGIIRTFEVTFTKTFV